MSAMDTRAWSNFYKIKKYCPEVVIKVERHNQGLVLNKKYLMAKRKTRFRPFGCTFWAHYTCKTIGEAFRDGRVMDYYYEMLADDSSAKNPRNSLETFEDWVSRKQAEGDISEYDTKSTEFLQQYIDEVHLK